MNWVLEHGLDGVLSSILAGVIGAGVVIHATRADSSRWVKDRADRDRAERQRDLDDFRTELANTYMAVEEALVTMPNNPPRRASIFARLSGRIVVLQATAIRAWPDAEGAIAVVSGTLETLIASERDLPWGIPTPAPDLTPVRDGLLELLRKSVEWRVDVETPNDRGITDRLRGLLRRPR